MANRANIEAVFYLSDDVKEPKFGGVKNSYSPHHKFKNIDYLVSGYHKYNDENKHYPGELLTVMITFASWEYIKDNINIGDGFEVREMNRTIGYGEVIKIL